jgi:hypothetical protein
MEGEKSTGDLIAQPSYANFNISNRNITTIPAEIALLFRIEK